MTHVPRGAPFAERGGRLRGVVDVVAGRYPPFVFGFGVGTLLPVFHFHETTRETLEPALQYLAENAYTTVQSDAVSAFVRRRVALPPRAVMLAFDDALASLWTVGAPLLRHYGLSAVTYAIPARMSSTSGLRRTIDDGPLDAAGDTADPFVTWDELRALSGSGLIDVQSHTWSHSMVFCGPEVVDFALPPRLRRAPLDRPRVNTNDPPAFLDPSRVGFPLLPRRSRMSEARRYLPDEAACEAVERYVASQGGETFLAAPANRDATLRRFPSVGGTWESETDRARDVEHELSAARDALEARLGTRVRHVCLPWGVGSGLARTLLERLGFETAFANRLTGMFAVRAGDDPFFLKRLENRHVFALPGRGRRTFALFA